MRFQFFLGHHRNLLRFINVNVKLGILLQSNSICKLRVDGQVVSDNPFSTPAHAQQWLTLPGQLGTGIA